MDENKNPIEQEQAQAAALAKVNSQETSSMQVFGSVENFEVAQRMAKCLASSKMIPVTYQNNIPDCLIALDMANRMGANPIMVMQNLYVVHGNPGWSSKFLIASLNMCGKFSPLRYHEENEKTDQWVCYAYAIDKMTGEELKGPEVSMEMAKKEGWYDKAGSKWKTMPQLMLHYRAAAFFQRTYAPEISMGLMTKEEVEDIDYEDVTNGAAPRKPNAFNPQGLSADEKRKQIEEARKRMQQANQPEDVEPVEETTPGTTLFPEQQ